MLGLHVVGAADRELRNVALEIDLLNQLHVGFLLADLLKVPASNDQLASDHAFGPRNDLLDRGLTERDNRDATVLMLQA